MTRIQSTEMMIRLQVTLAVDLVEIMVNSDPINEMKPDVTAPGTDVVQAEACVT